ncbi:hypothetical protein DLAC_10117 [Tieghemostelium lacteum]|uniref:Uncharacterized protein n=1 Tax=Tieghemostelium lacteum TaxID=361077 RepID=A0A151Z665_TIELA|nr:hypothetical protein DLAC_10117 [Tieghemostelium lacteum]|eukprot:KYQ89449.1 hypothetical protein DLAC_10117 [Tieghemostelium lacteum]
MTLFPNYIYSLIVDYLLDDVRLFVSNPNCIKADINDDDLCTVLIHEENEGNLLLYLCSLVTSISKEWNEKVIRNMKLMTTNLRNFTDPGAAIDFISLLVNQRNCKIGIGCTPGVETYVPLDLIYDADIFNVINTNRVQDTLDLQNEMPNLKNITSTITEDSDSNSQQQNRIYNYRGKIEKVILKPHFSIIEPKTLSQFLDSLDVGSNGLDCRELILHWPYKNIEINNFEVSSLKNYMAVEKLTFHQVNLSPNSLCTVIGYLEKLVYLKVIVDPINLGFIDMDFETLPTIYYDTVLNRLSTHRGIKTFILRPASGGTLRETSIENLLTQNSVLKRLELYDFKRIHLNPYDIVISNSTIEYLHLGSFSNSVSWDGKPPLSYLSLDILDTRVQAMLTHNFIHSLGELNINENVVTTILPLLEQSKVFHSLTIAMKYGQSVVEKIRFIKAIKQCKTLRNLKILQTRIPIEYIVDIIELEHPSLVNLQYIGSNSIYFEKLGTVIANNKNIKVLDIEAYGVPEPSVYQIYTNLTQILESNKCLEHLKFPTFYRFNENMNQNLYEFLKKNTTLYSIDWPEFRWKPLDNISCHYLKLPKRLLSF